MESAACLKYSDLAGDFKFDRTMHEANGVEVFQFNFGPKLLVINLPHRNISFAAQVSLLHVRFRCANPLQSAPYVIYVVVSLPGSAKIWLSHNFSQGSAGSIEIDVGITVDIRQAFVNVFAGIFFKMKTSDRDLLGQPFNRMTQPRRARQS